MTQSTPVMTDWEQKRIDANPPASLADLRSAVVQAVLAVCSVPPPGWPPGDGTAAREAWRRFLHGTIHPPGEVVAEEVRAKLGTDVEAHLPVDTLAFELQIAGESVAERTPQLLMYIETAARMVEDFSIRPVRTTERVIVAPAAGVRDRSHLGEMLGARVVARAEYAIDTDGPGQFSAEVAAAHGQVGGAETIGSTRLVAPPASGWPAAAVLYRLTVAVSTSPQDHPEAGQAMALIRQGLFQGRMVVADGWKKLLPPAGL